MLVTAVFLAAFFSMAGCVAFQQEAGLDERVARTLPVREPLRISTGEPQLGIYYFGHWWEPQKSDDEAIRKDFRKLKELGFNTIYVDHEASQAMPGDFHHLTRQHRLAKEASIQVLPWLSLKFRDMSREGRVRWSEERYGVGLFVSKKHGYLPYAPESIEFMVEYASDYIKRYKDEALLHIKKDGQDCPVVAITAEVGWPIAGYANPETNMLFSRFLWNRYGDIESLNEAWGVEFKDFFYVDPQDEKLFTVDRENRELSPASTDYLLFRGQMMSDILFAVKAGLRKQYPNIQIAVEIPYGFGDELGVVWNHYVSNGITRNIAEHADIVILRGCGIRTERSRQIVSEYIDNTGKDVIFTHRISPTQGPGDGKLDRATIADLYAREAATCSTGLGYYSWNEMLDVHMLPNEGTSAPPTAFCKVSQEQHERLCEIVNEINHKYLDIHREGNENISVPLAGIQSRGLKVLY